MKQIIAMIALGSCLWGCQSRVATNTPRTALEQMLLSGAVDTALEKLKIPSIVGKKVWLDFTNLKAYDVEYIKAATRARMAQMGAVLAAKAAEAELVVEVASGALGIEAKSSIVGVPPLPMPNSPVATPQVPFYSSREQTGIVKLFFLVTRNGEYVEAYHSYAKCDRDENQVFGVKFHCTDEVRTRWAKADEALETKASGYAGR